MNNNYETNMESSFNKNLLYEYIDILTGKRLFINTGWNYFGESFSKEDSFAERQCLNKGILYLINFAARFIYGYDTYEKAVLHKKEIFKDTKLDALLKKRGKGLTLPSLDKTIYLTDKETILWMIYNNKDLNKDILDVYVHLIGRHPGNEKELRDQYVRIKRLVNKRMVRQD